ncbi:3'-5' exonuclease [Vallitalea pronyensis]|uniref:3'-5' exonuclease n=1 Tax=Vallitalea pronyensis TaxID=1348613 RepID=A0A8J8SJB1_9FIRM|nr:3'-5' exonuclease [Vallitalea pronyensis]QUI25481.1 3'-5' exonuclease [Vallitalea pronyensis]
MESFVVFDIETTGISPTNHRITEIGAIKVVNNQVVEEFNQLINPEVVIPNNIVALTGITDKLVKNEPMIEDVLPEFIDFCRDFVIMGHNIAFDFSFIKANALRHKLVFEKHAIDTLTIARKVLCELPSRKLSSLCKHYAIDYLNGHRAYNDAYCTYELFNRLKQDYYEKHPELFVAKPIHWKPAKTSAITSKQKAFLAALVKRHQVILDKQIDELTKSEASQAIDRIIHLYGKAR